MSAARQVDSAAELLQEVGVELESIQFFSLSAKANESPESVDPPAEIEPVYSLLVRQEDNEIGVRLSTAFDLGIGELSVDAAANYKTVEPVMMSEIVRLDFANNVGLMALLPYVRQAVADLSQRVFNQPLLMPIIQRGELHFTVDDRDEPDGPVDRPRELKSE